LITVILFKQYMLWLSSLWTFSTLCHFIPLRPKYFPKHPVLKHTQIMPSQDTHPTDYNVIHNPLLQVFALHPVHHVCLNLITLIMLRGQYKLWSSTSSHIQSKSEAHSYAS
jgi:hypothetical protein